MRILYIDGVGQFGGASRSLYELVGRLREADIQPYFLGSRGTVQTYYDRVAVDSLYAKGLSRFNNSITGYYKGFRWLIVLREIRNLPYTVVAAHAARNRFGPVDLIHINEIHDLPAGLIAKYFFRAPMVVHLRCCQREDRKSWRVRMFHWVLRRHADSVIAIDENTRATLPSDISVQIVHNSFSVGYTPPFEADRTRLLSGDRLTVGFIGNVMRSKGVLELVKAASILKARGIDVQVKIVGGRIRKLGGIKRRLLMWFGLEEDALPEVEKLVEVSELGDRVEFTGHVDDIQAVIPTFDVIAFPSYFDAPGRPIFEAAFFRVPSISCISNPRPDTVQPGETGLVVAARSPAELADAIEYFSHDRREVIRMGDNAYELAWRNFVPEANAAVVRRVYLKFQEAKTGP